MSEVFFTVDKKQSPLNAIKEYCIRCSGDSYSEMKRCSSEDCPLFCFRLGKNPFRKKRQLTDEQKARVAERFKQYRESKT